MALSHNNNPEYDLLFDTNFTTALKALGTLKDGINIQYLRTLVQGEVLCHFSALSAEAESASLETLIYIILGLGTYFFL